MKGKNNVKKRTTEMGITNNVERDSNFIRENL